MPTITLSLKDETDQALDAIAQATAHTKTDLVNWAIDACLTHYAWQAAAIRDGITEADAGELVDHQSLHRHWEAKLADSLD